METNVASELFMYIEQQSLQNRNLSTRLFGKKNLPRFYSLRAAFLGVLSFFI
jgi:hypothetical protein